MDEKQEQEVLDRKDPFYWRKRYLQSGPKIEVEEDLDLDSEVDIVDATDTNKNKLPKDVE
jgi:hypothetical protein